MQNNKEGKNGKIKKIELIQNKAEIVENCDKVQRGPTETNSKMGDLIQIISTNIECK